MHRPARRRLQRLDRALDTTQNDPAPAVPIGEHLVDHAPRLGGGYEIAGPRFSIQAQGGNLAQALVLAFQDGTS
jgi:hypothetical protein